MSQNMVLVPASELALMNARLTDLENAVGVLEHALDAALGSVAVLMDQMEEEDKTEPSIFLEMMSP